MFDHLLDPRAQTAPPRGDLHEDRRGIVWDGKVGSPTLIGESGLQHLRKALAGWSFTNPRDAQGLLRRLATRMGVSPRISVHARSLSKRLEGFYRDGAISMNCRGLATLLHEFAHHVKECRVGARGTSHGKDFKDALLDVYREFYVMTGVGDPQARRVRAKRAAREPLPPPGTRVTVKFKGNVRKDGVITRRMRTRVDVQIEEYSEVYTITCHPNCLELLS